jgi:hypothetical protein
MGVNGLVLGAIVQHYSHLAIALGVGITGLVEFELWEVLSPRVTFAIAVAGSTEFLVGSMLKATGGALCVGFAENPEHMEAEANYHYLLSPLKHGFNCGRITLRKWRVDLMDPDQCLRRQINAQVQVELCHKTGQGRTVFRNNLPIVSV